MIAAQRRSDPLPVIQYWHDEEPPDYILELCATFREHNPGMRQLLFDERMAMAFIAEHFGPREVAAFRTCAVPAMQADYFRYCAVHVLGGIYVDVDFRCERPLDGLAEFDGMGRLFEQEHGGIVNGIFIFTSPRHPVLSLALEIATANIEHRVSQNVWGVTGPAIFFALVKLHQLGSIDAFLEFARKRRLGIDSFGCPIWDPQLCCTVIDDYARVAEALECVLVTPFAKTLEWMSSVRTPYHKTSIHWPRWDKDIYR